MMHVLNEYFEIVPALSKELKRDVYKLRYQVFCCQTGIFNVDDYPDGIEYDEFDAHSLHFLIRHRASGMYVATTRLILPDINNIDKPFPLQLYCKIDNYELLNTIDRSNLGEASRFGISKEFKKRKNESGTLTGINSGNLDNHELFTAVERRVLPHLCFALISCLIKACYENNIDYFFSALEPAFFRFLASSGINFTKLGPLVDYHGGRWACIIKVSDLLDGVWEKDKSLWAMLTDNGRYAKPAEVS